MTKALIIHGTENGYSNHCCRCRECKAAHANYLYKRRKEGNKRICLKCQKDKVYYAKGLCRSCYDSQRRQQQSLKPETGQSIVKKLQALETAFKGTKQGQQFYSLLKAGYSVSSIAHSNYYQYVCKLVKTNGQIKRFRVNSKYVFLLEEGLGAKREQPLWEK